MQNNLRKYEIDFEETLPWILTFQVWYRKYKFFKDKNIIIIGIYK